LLPEAVRVRTEGGREALYQHWSDKIAVDGKTSPASTARELFSRPDSIVDTAALGRDLASVDLFHLHWVSGFLDHDNIEHLLGDRPVVWTLHDMNPFTGGCHYSEGCEGYKKDCRNCPLLEKGAKLANETWKTKKKAYDKIKNLHIVCPSQWIADCARASSLFGNRKIHVIPNVSPIDDFLPTNKIVARMRLGLPLNRKLIAFGADSLDNLRKGGDILGDSLNHLQHMGGAEGVEGILFGASSLDLNIKVHNMGYVSDPKKLSLIYAAADVFAFPSREDNAPQTVIEAMLSGTPVVAFPVGNIEQLVTHGETGYIATYEDARAFAQGLHWALKNPRSTESLLRGVRSHLAARAHSDPDKVVERHVALYQEILKE
jgi:glycosyltransferase involved in cell wall biosynthesis